MSHFTSQTLNVCNMCANLLSLHVFSYVVGPRQRRNRGGWRVLLGAGDGHGGVCALGRHRVPLLLLWPDTTTEHTGLRLRHWLLWRRNYKKKNKWKCSVIHIFCTPCSVNVLFIHKKWTFFSSLLNAQIIFSLNKILWAV